MKKNDWQIGCLIILSLGFICAGAIIISWLTWDAYFADFEGKEAVKDHILLTSGLVLNESSIEDVQKIIDTQVYGRMDCSFSSFDNRTLACLTPKSRYWWYYNILFTFDDATVVELEVGEVYLGL